MATYAAYRHIELDKVGYSKKRVRNVPSSEITKVISTPEQNGAKLGSKAGNITPRRRLSSTDSFNRLFGDSPMISTPRRASLTKHDVTNRNPVTGDGVQSWDARPSSRSTPKVHTERNPVTGEVYTIVSPATTPTKAMTNGIHKLHNGNPELPMGPTTNGQA